MSVYPEEMVLPMRSELTEEGFVEWRSAEVVRQYFENPKGLALVVINSVCGCAAGSARPGVRTALSLCKQRPEGLYTVFAGVDTEAVQEFRRHTSPYPPSSPSIALFKEGQLVHFVERHHIEGQSAQAIAQHLSAVIEEHSP